MHSALRNVLKAAPGFILAMALGGAALAADPPERVVMQPPAKNAAVMAKMPGMVNNLKAKTLTGRGRVINDGLVIRKSYIRDGKIVIPPSGLYLTVRSENWHPFDNEPLTLAGKMYHAINFRNVREVMRNVEFKPGQTISLDSKQSRGFQLTMLENFAYGIDGGSEAEFKFVKATGNYYGENFPTFFGPKVSNAGADGTFVMGSKQPVGHTVPTQENGLTHATWGTNIATVGRTYIIVDKVEGETVKVREMATDTCTALFISPNDPLVASYGKGDSFTVGNAKVDVTDVTANAVTVKITDKAGSVTRTLGPLTTENTRMLLMDTVERERIWAQSKDGTVAVHLNIRPANPPIAEGKASLVAYADVMEIGAGTVWPVDPRFLGRPET